jgi:hypothetical protein
MWIVKLALNRPVPPPPVPPVPPVPPPLPPPTVWAVTMTLETLLDRSDEESVSVSRASPRALVVTVPPREARVP